MSIFMADQKIFNNVNYPQGFPYGYNPNLKGIKDMPTDDLLAYWNMAKSVDDKIIESVNGYDAIVRDGIDTPDGIAGNALIFDGTTEVDLGILPGTYNKYTLSMWVKLANMTTPGALYYAARNADDDFLIVIEDGYLKCINYIGVDAFSLDTADVLPQDEWLHLLYTYNSELKRIYVNNLLQGEQAVIGHLLGTTECHEVGYYSPIFGKHYKGAIDQVRFYNNTVTLEARNKLYSERLI